MCSGVLQILHWNCLWDLFFRLARQTSHCGRPPDGVSFLIGSGNARSLSLIGRTLVGATCLLSTRRLWPSNRLATMERQKYNWVKLFSATVLYKMLLAFTIARSSK